MRQRFLTERPAEQPHRVHPYPRGGSLCTSSGHSLSTTARISSEMTVTFLMSSMYLCNRRKSAGVITLPDRKIGGLRPPQNLVDQVAGAPLKSMKATVPTGVENSYFS
jgi:hypothetical protein